MIRIRRFLGHPKKHRLKAVRHATCLQRAVRTLKLEVRNRSKIVLPRGLCPSGPNRELFEDAHATMGVSRTMQAETSARTLSPLVDM